MWRKMMGLGVAVVMVMVVVAMSLRAREAEAQVPGMPNTLTSVLVGNYRVQYQMLYLNSQAKEDKMELVNRIEFHEDYVVLIDQNGAGKLLPVHAIREINWNRS
jgi:hypothetical protein